MAGGCSSCPFQDVWVPDSRFLLFWFSEVLDVESVLGVWVSGFLFFCVPGFRVSRVLDCRCFCLSGFWISGFSGVLDVDSVLDVWVSGFLIYRGSVSSGGLA